MRSEAAKYILVIDEPNPYYCQTDENHFFAWLQSIPVVKEVKGTPSGLELIVQLPVDKASLRDLIALMTRYGLDRRPLKLLCDEHPDEYFRDPKKYWHSAIYG